MRRYGSLLIACMVAMVLASVAASSLSYIDSGWIELNSGGGTDDGYRIDGFEEIDSVIGTDERIRILNTTSDPYPKIALLEAIFPSGFLSCTGWFIGLDSVVTAGHCVYYAPYGGWADEVLVAPAANLSASDGSVIFPYGTQTSTVYFTPVEWSVSALPEYDYAVVRLPDTTLGEQTGYFAFGYYSDAYFDTTFEANLAGYPLDKPYPTMWLSIDDHSGVDGGILSYLVDTYSGESGAPVWKSSMVQRTVIGIHTRNTLSASCVPGTNCGVRITPDVADDLILWGAAQPPQTDCQLLGVQITPLIGGAVHRFPEYAPGCRDSEYVEDSALTSSVVTLTAIPESGYVFIGWQGANSDIENPTTITMTHELTVTATFTEATPGPVSLEAMSVDDDDLGNSSGNDDGIPNCGERLELDLTLRNAGYGTATSVTATATTSHTLVTVVDGAATIGDIDALTVITSTADLVVDVLPDYEGSTQVELKFTFTDSEGTTWEDSAVLDIYCPVQNVSPYSPSNPSPGDDAEAVDVNATLVWQGGDPDDDIVTYDVYLASGAITQDSLICEHVTELVCDPDGLDYATLYYWQVIAQDELGAVTVGDIWKFTTMRSNTAPIIPTAPSPDHGADDQSLDVILQWSGGDPDGDPVTYDVYFDAGSAVPAMLLCDDVPVASCNAPTLDYGATYSWYVVARDALGATSTGDVWFFVTDNTRTLFLPYIVRE